MLPLLILYFQSSIFFFFLLSPLILAHPKQPKGSDL